MEKVRTLFKQTMTVLSLFDGISCGQQALKELGVKVHKYYASEIHFPSIKIAQKNFPGTIQLGTVTAIKGKHLPKIDLLMGGSPCQGFSFTGKMLNFDDPRSKLFWEFVRLVKECKPRYWLLENVDMKKEYQDTINKALKTKPVVINSSLVSAQNRKRLYWCNWEVVQPKDSHITLRDIVSTKIFDGTVTQKSTDASHFNGRERVLKSTDKSFTLVSKDICAVPKVGVNFKTYRRLSTIEVERLQGLPDNYTQGISNNQRLLSIGNGWNIPTIKHILNQITK